MFEDFNVIQDYLGALPLGGYRSNIAKPKANQQFPMAKQDLDFQKGKHTNLQSNQTLDSPANQLGSVSFSIPKIGRFQISTGAPQKF